MNSEAAREPCGRLRLSRRQSGAPDVRHAADGGASLDRHRQHLAFMIYAWAGDLMPVLVLHALLLPLNIARLREFSHVGPGRTRAGRPAGKGAPRLGQLRSVLRAAFGYQRLERSQSATWRSASSRAMP